MNGILCFDCGTRIAGGICDSCGDDICDACLDENGHCHRCTMLESHWIEMSEEPMGGVIVNDEFFADQGKEGDP